MVPLFIFYYYLFAHFSTWFLSRGVEVLYKEIIVQQKDFQPIESCFNFPAAQGILSYLGYVQPTVLSNFLSKDYVQYQSSS